MQPSSYLLSWIFTCLALLQRQHLHQVLGRWPEKIHREKMRVLRSNFQTKKSLFSACEFPLQGAPRAVARRNMAVFLLQEASPAEGRRGRPEHRLRLRPSASASKAEAEARRKCCYLTYNYLLMFFKYIHLWNQSRTPVNVDNTTHTCV